MRPVFAAVAPLAAGPVYLYPFGQRIGSSLFIQVNQTISYPLQGFSADIYVARFTYGSKALALRFMIR